MIYFLGGIIVTIFIIWLVVLSFAYGLSGKSPLLLRPIQLLMVGSVYDRIRLLFWVSLILFIIYVIYNHVGVNITLK